MSKPFYTPEKSRLQAQGAEAADMARQRAALRAALALQPGETVLDIGCGNGRLLADLAPDVGPAGRCLGIDAEASAVATGQEALPDAQFHTADAAALPLPDGSIDAAVTAQVLCYIADVDVALAEIARVLRPGGRAVILDTDWDTLVWASRAPDLMARARTALLSPMTHADIPRQLGPRLARAGLQTEALDTLTFASLAPSEGSYAQISETWAATLMAEDPAFPDADRAAWTADREALTRDGGYFFTVTRFIFSVRKRG